MKRKIILDQTPGRTVYAGARAGQVYHAFTDEWACPETNCVITVPGKGALAHRISAFLMQKLQTLGLQTAFLRACNMRESLMTETFDMPFSVTAHGRACVRMSESLMIEPLWEFDPPLFEWRAPACPFHLNEDFVMGLDWIDRDELTEVKALTLKAAQWLQGLFAAFDLMVISTRLQWGRDSEGDFVLTGPLCPETLAVYHPASQSFWGGDALKGAPEVIKDQHIAMAQAMALMDTALSCPPATADQEWACESLKGQEFHTSVTLVKPSASLSFPADGGRFLQNDASNAAPDAQTCDEETSD